MVWDNITKKVPKLVERDGTRCHYCGHEMDFTNPSSGRFRTVDHKKPQSEGGDKSLENLVLACWACNHKKGNRDYETFVALLKSQKQQKRLKQQQRRIKKKQSSIS